MKTIKECAQAALDMQEACNLSGVLATWMNVRDVLNASPEREGTHWFNNHPVNQLFASKVHDLCGMGFSDGVAFSNAYESCKKLVE